MLSAIFTQVLMLSVAGGIVALAILILRAVFWRKMPARLQYALWALLIVRLLLPIAPSSPLSLFALSMPGTAARQNVTENKDVSSIAFHSKAAITQPETAVKPQTPTVPTDTQPQAAPVSAAKEALPKVQTPTIKFGVNFETAAVVWIFGAAVLLIYFLIVNLAMRIAISRLECCHDRTVTSTLDDCLAKLKLRVPVKIVCDRQSKSPGVFGIRRPYIIISKTVLEHMDTSGLRYILLHELTHVKRHDNAVNLVIMLMEAVNWFNPVLWFAFNKMKEDCEISCDASVLAALCDDERRAYGNTIISVLQAIPQVRLIPGEVGFINNFSKRRIVMIANSNKKISVLTIAVVLTAALLAGGASLPGKVQKTKSPAVQPSLVSAASNQTVSNAKNTPSPQSKVSSTSTIKKKFISYVNKAGYDVIKGSMKGGMTISLPKGVNPPLTDAIVWKFILKRNTFSKNNGLDFSPYFGKGVVLRYCDGKNRSTGRTTEFVCLCSGSRLVGFWAMPRLKDVGLPDISYKYNRDSSVLTHALHHSVYEDDDWDAYLTPWFEYDNGIKNKLLEKAGYRVEYDGSDTYSLTVPRSFSAVVKGYKVGAYLKACNKLSKSYGYDFSSYLGKKATIDIDSVENVFTQKVSDCFSLYSGKKLIGFWFGSEKSWRILDSYRSGLLKH